MPQCDIAMSIVVGVKGIGAKDSHCRGPFWGVGWWAIQPLKGGGVEDDIAYTIELGVCGGGR